MNEIICMTLGAIATLIIGILVYICYKFGPGIFDYIQRFIRFHMNKRK